MGDASPLEEMLTTRIPKSVPSAQSVVPVPFNVDDFLLVPEPRYGAHRETLSFAS